MVARQSKVRKKYVNTTLSPKTVKSHFWITHGIKVTLS